MVQNNNINNNKRSNTVVCDIGSSSIKVGMAGSLTPDVIIPCLIGCRRNYHWKSYKDMDRIDLIGTDAIQAGKRQKIGYQYPMTEKGNVQDWKSLEVLLREAFSKLDISDLSRYNVLITKPYNMKRSDLKTLLDMFFMVFEFRAVTMHEQAALVLYTQGIETGVVVEMGESMINITPIYRGHAIPKLEKNQEVGGRAITSHLLKLLRLKGYQLNEQEDTENGREIKEKYCYVSVDPNEDEKLASETTSLVESFRLPDATVISMGRERFDATEVLFQPSLINCESKSLPNIIFEAIQEADIDCRADLYRNIIVSGGTSLLRGLPERLEKDLHNRYVRDVLNSEQSRSLGWTARVLAPESRKHLVFEGAALFADLIRDETSFWVTLKDYTEGGIQTVLDKCNIR
jgi:actin-related protein 2